MKFQTVPIKSDTSADVLCGKHVMSSDKLINYMKVKLIDCRRTLNDLFNAFEVKLVLPVWRGSIVELNLS